MLTEKQIQDRIFYLRQQNVKLENMAKKAKCHKEVGKCVMYALENEHRVSELVKVLEGKDGL